MTLNRPFAWNSDFGPGEDVRQALGRFPWLAPFFLRARRLRPVLPIWSS